MGSGLIRTGLVGDKEPASSIRPSSNSTAGRWRVRSDMGSGPFGWHERGVRAGFAIGYSITLPRLPRSELSCLPHGVCGLHLAMRRR